MQFLPAKPKFFRTINTFSSSSCTTTLLNNYNNRASEQHCLSLLLHCNTFPKLTQLHTLILKLGLQNNPLVLTKFASTSSDLDAIDYASSFIFSPESQTGFYDAFLFNNFIRAYAQTNQSRHHGVNFYNVMLRCGVLPNKFTYVFVLKACAGLGELGLGKSVHGSALKYGFDDDGHVQNTLIHMYSCCGGGGIGFARKVFDEMPKLDSVTWSAMIGGYVRFGQSADAVGLFREMQIAGVRPDEITMVSVLSACTDLGALELGKWVESYIEREMLQKGVQLCNALIDMFAKCGNVDKAMRMFRNMSERTIVSWTSVIVGMAMHGRGSDAISLFEEMKADGVSPDHVAFTAVLSACSHSGLVKEGHQYFNSMIEGYAIMPKLEHYGCMVDLLCKAGLVEEALEFIQKMPIRPNPIIWRTFISGCREHGKLELGESITKQLIREEPMQEANYVLLSNIYAKMSHWEKKIEVREVMEQMGMRKIPGSTMIKLDSAICEFVCSRR